MADNYVQFSFTVEATLEQSVWVNAIIEDCRSYNNGERKDSEFDPVVLRCLAGGLEPDVEAEWEDGSLWFHADEYGDIEFTANLLHEMLRQFDRNDKVGFTWATTCSKMRPDEFSGGAVAISKDDVDYCSLGEWLSNKLAPSLEPSAHK